MEQASGKCPDAIWRRVMILLLAAHLTCSYAGEHSFRLFYRCTLPPSCGQVQRACTGLQRLGREAKD